jgi:pSer/pThr/pTyr-binding forkhead associated (FHA) protein
MPISFPIDINVSRQDGGSAQSWVVSITGPGVYTAGLITDNDIVLDAEGVAARHMMIDLTGDAVKVSSVEPDLPLKINGTFVSEAELKPGDRVELPGHTVSYGKAPAAQPAQSAAAPRAEAPRAAPAPRASAEPPPAERVELSYVLDRPSEGATSTEEDFPGAWFRDPERVSISKLHASGHNVEEVGFLAIGGGLGSFTWVDHLRVYGADASDIRVVGIDPICYSNYKRYCRNSQIPDHERLRSNSQSTPDNIWGFPGYASRETLSDLARFRISGLKHIYQVFGEPNVAESFTPRAGRVFDSLEREMTRIGWHDMFVRARALSLRMTDDGRYALAIREIEGSNSRAQRERFIVARQVHVATGYPTTRFVEDFRVFFAQNRSHRKYVANAYQQHDHIYQECESTREPRYVVVRGRGIVASRIIQRLSEARAVNPNVQIIHSIRSRLGDNEGAKWQRAARIARNNVELQPFNWPKSCWTGDLRREYESKGLKGRSELNIGLGGTTTADRDDWQRLVRRGTQEGWYRPVFGNITGLKPRSDGVTIEVRTTDGHTESIQAHYLVDCTGLIGDILRSPFLNDLVGAYNLPRNAVIRTGRDGKESRTAAGLYVTDHFEIDTLRNGEGRVWASGTITTGGPYLAVDSFLGLQYAAFRAVEAMTHDRTKGIRRLGALRSTGQWVRWAVNAAP